MKHQLFLFIFAIVPILTLTSAETEVEEEPVVKEEAHRMTPKQRFIEIRISLLSRQYEQIMMKRFEKDLEVMMLRTDTDPTDRVAKKKTLKSLVAQAKVLEKVSNKIKDDLQSQMRESELISSKKKN